MRVEKIMPIPFKYPKRTDYSKLIKEGCELLFDVYKRECVAVAWFAKSENDPFGRGTYRITRAWKAETRAEAIKLPDYPFIRTKFDKATVTSYIMNKCLHQWQYWNYHSVCAECGLWVHDDYRKIVAEREGTDAVKLNDDYIKAQYGLPGLALRQSRVGIKVELKKEWNLIRSMK